MGWAPAKPITPPGPISTRHPEARSAVAISSYRETAFRVLGSAFRVQDGGYVPRPPLRRMGWAPAKPITPLAPFLPVIPKREPDKGIFSYDPAPPSQIPMTSTVSTFLTILTRSTIWTLSTIWTSWTTCTANAFFVCNAFFYGVLIFHWSLISGG